MEEAKKLGLTKSIGISNFNISQIQRLLENCEIKPAVLQVEVRKNCYEVDLRKWGSYPFLSIVASKIDMLNYIIIDKYNTFQLFTGFFSYEVGSVLTEQHSWE